MKIFSNIIAFFIVGNLFSQNPVPDFTGTKRYWVTFTDKSNTPYTTQSPEAYLSKKAIARRVKYNIPITPQDFPINPSYLKSITDIGASLQCRTKWLNAAIVIPFTDEQVEAIRALPFIKNIELAAPYKKPKRTNGANKDATTTYQQAIAKQNSQPSIDYKNIPYGAGEKQATMCRTNVLHSQNYLGQGMTIAIFDVGFYHADTIKAFQRLYTNGQILGTKDFVAGGSSVYEDGWHGMQVLSCIASYLPNKFIGTAPEASFWLFRTEDDVSETMVEEVNWANAVEMADSVGADVINSSLGYTNFDNPATSYTYKDMTGDVTIAARAADIAASKGILIVNSAGNAAEEDWHYIGTPADGDSVLAIGAVDINGKYASFSSVGPAPDGRIKPNVSCLGLSATVINPAGQVATATGTSFASPIMAGMVTCLWQANPSSTNMEVIDALQRSANKANTPNGEIGYGIPNLAYAHFLLQNKSKMPNVGIVEASSKNNSIDVVIYSASNQKVKIIIKDKNGKKLAKNKIKLLANQLTNWNSLIPNAYTIEIQGNKSKCMQVVVE